MEVIFGIQMIAPERMFFSTISSYCIVWDKGRPALKQAFSNASYNFNGLCSYFRLLVCGISKI